MTKRCRYTFSAPHTAGRFYSEIYSFYSIFRLIRLQVRTRGGIICGGQNAEEKRNEKTFIRI